MLHLAFIATDNGREPATEGRADDIWEAEAARRETAADKRGTQPTVRVIIYDSSGPADGGGGGEWGGGGGRGGWRNE